MTLDEASWCVERFGPTAVRSGRGAYGITLTDNTSVPVLAVRSIRSRHDPEVMPTLVCTMRKVWSDVRCGVWYTPTYPQLGDRPFRERVPEGGRINEAVRAFAADVGRFDALCSFLEQLPSSSSYLGWTGSRRAQPIFQPDIIMPAVSAAAGHTEHEVRFGHPIRPSDIVRNLLDLPNIQPRFIRMYADAMERLRARSTATSNTRNSAKPYWGDELYGSGTDEASRNGALPFVYSAELECMRLIREGNGYGIAILSALIDSIAPGTLTTKRTDPHALIEGTAIRLFDEGFDELTANVNENDIPIEMTIEDLMDKAAASTGMTA